MTYVGGAANDPWTNFNSQNSYTWSNGDAPASGSNYDTTNAMFSSIGDGIRMNFDVSVAGTYQLKFYATTYDVNLDASISLSSGGVSETVAGSYASNALQRYEYTVDFTTERCRHRHAGRDQECRRQLHCRLRGLLSQSGERS